MPGLRVLVVNDSVVIRKILCEALASDPAIEVAGSAADGSIALGKVPQVNPDLITLDVEMPVCLVLKPWRRSARSIQGCRLSCLAHSPRAAPRSRAYPEDQGALRAKSRRKRPGRHRQGRNRENCRFQNSRHFPNELTWSPSEPPRAARTRWRRFCRVLPRTSPCRAPFGPFGQGQQRWFPTSSEAKRTPERQGLAKNQKGRPDFSRRP